MSRYFHTIHFPDGSSVQGRVDHYHTIEMLEISPELMAGKRVLDLGSNDGVMSFWAEWNGASEVISTEVDGYRDYDWGPAGPPDCVEKLRQQDKSEIFWEHHRKTGSNVIRKILNAYDTRKETVGRFDIIFNFGLIYHLQNPRICINNCAEMCREVMFLETEVIQSLKGMGAVTIDAGHKIGVMGKTDMCIPSVGAVAHWLVAAGFEYSYFDMRTSNRARYIACRNKEIADRWRFNPDLALIDDRVIRLIKSDTNRLLGYT